MEKLDEAWEAINALGGNGRSNNLYDDAVIKTVERALDIIEALGGSQYQDNSYDQGVVDTVAKALEAIEALGEAGGLIAPARANGTPSLVI